MDKITQILENVVRCKYFEVDGCKHSKVDQTSAPVFESRGFLGQTPISSSKPLLKIDYFHDDLYC